MHHHHHHHHHFASQLRPEQDTTHSLRARQYKKTRSTGLHDSHDDSSEPPSPGHRPPPTSTAQSSASYASPELAQLRVAGLLPGEEGLLPPAPFPHAPATASKDYYGSTQAQQDMARAPIRLYAVSATRKGELVSGHPHSHSLKRRHLSIVSAILHRCLLAGDYQRAGKAWGIILRTQVAGGHPVDPRNHGRWGLGAEILLRRQSAHVRAHTEHQPSSADHQSDLFSEEGFELAREYYERMIVQHPARRTHPHVVDERTFYPAMFSLWIFEVCEKSKRARQKAQRERRPSLSSEGAHEVDMDAESAQEHAVLVEELAQAMEIAERIDRIIVSPPFDKQTSLLQLRGHVGVWMSDLTMGKTVLDEDWVMGNSLESQIESKATSDQLTRLVNGQRELLHAKEVFIRAENSGSYHELATMSSIDVRLKEIARQIAMIQTTEDFSF
ncbi:hypothetical protein ACN47E_006777 [Coniothyrium glycines]